jgi:hypothetical protein
MTTVIRGALWAGYFSGQLYFRRWVNSRNQNSSWKPPPNHTNTDEALAVSVAGKKIMLYSELKKIASDGFRTTLAVFTHNP